MHEESQRMTIFQIIKSIKQIEPPTFGQFEKVNCSALVQRINRWSSTVSIWFCDCSCTQQCTVTAWHSLSFILSMDNIFLLTNQQLWSVSIWFLVKHNFKLIFDNAVSFKAMRTVRTHFNQRLDWSLLRNYGSTSNIFSISNELQSYFEF